MTISVDKTLIYIGGLGRSGSTLLDLLLNNSPYVASVGEVHRLNLYARNGEPCTCGQPVDECPFWMEVQQAARRELKMNADEPVLKTKEMMLCPDDLSPLGSMLQKATLVLGSPTLYRLGRQLFSKPHYEASQNALFWYEMIRRVTGSPIIVDSTKDARRLKVLYFADPKRFRLIHLVRDGRAVAASHMRRLNISMKEAAKTSLSTNRRFRLAARGIPKHQRIRVQYEALCRTPEATMQRLCTFLGIPYEQDMLVLRKELSHNIGGNPMRLRKDEIEIRLDERWKTELTAQDLAVFDQIAGTENRRSGYDE